MQKVSEEWLENQTRPTRKQGFVNIKISNLDGTETTISSLTNATDIISVVHNRGYDPMALSLPYNTIEIELYNFAGQYTHYYTQDVVGFKIVVEYGYKLSTNETIKGGTFYATSVEIDRDTIVITGASSLALLQDKNVDMIEFEDDKRILWQGNRDDSEGRLTDAEIEGQWGAFTVGEILAKAQTAGLSVQASSNIAEMEVYTGASVDVKLSDAVQYIANVAQCRFYIDRYDVVILTIGYSDGYGFVDYLNVKEKMLLTQTKKVQYVDGTSCVAGTDTEHYSSDEAGEEIFSDESGNRFIRFTLDINFLEKHINSVSYYGILREIYVQREANDYSGFSGFVRFPYEYKLCFVLRYFSSSSESRPYIQQLNTTTVTENVSFQSEVYNTIGEICDITNPYGVPQDIEKYKKYYDNCRTYEVVMRGQPELDVGDYVSLEMVDGTRVMALILESELEFNGTFTDTMTVRIIETEFEDMGGLTHEQLEEYTHAQLEEYTHEQLETLKTLS